MKRKLIQLGKSTLVVSIPQKWAKEQELNPGSELDLEIKENALLLTKEAEIIEKKIEINAHQNTNTTKRIIATLYRQGFTEITIKNPNENNIKEIYNITEKRLIGFEVVTHKDKKCILRQLGKIDSYDFDNALRRLFLLILDLANETVEVLEKKQKQESAKFIEDNINKFSTYCERLLIIFRNKLKKSYDYYYLVKQLENLGDHYYYLTKETFKKNPINELKDANENLRELYELFYNFNFEKMDELYTKLRKEAKDAKKSNKNQPILEIKLRIDELISPVVAINIE
ncbi:phosphate uptake regulator PhoU [Candidatus Woesearchaeota archaeon]|jgi:phosphate uptake regulator|nr:phosphate uptake regulator PhoU [Candidatus Woesearchaeota archaeon]